MTADRARTDGQVALRKRILLVEDDDGNARVISMMCELGGYEVLRADNGLAALALLVREHVDLVLLDVRMPLFDGPATLRSLRAHPHWEALPVVFLTAMLLPGERERLGVLGASSVLAKPVRRAALLDCLEQVLAAS